MITPRTGRQRLAYLENILSTIENVVYLELIRRRNKIWVGKYDNLEVDFVTTNTDEMVYYQVATRVSEGNTLERELTPLINIRDNYPKYLLLLDGKANSGASGIKVVNIIDWLLEKD